LLLTAPPILAESEWQLIDAEAMGQAIDATGRVALDTIHFDFGSAMLLPTSDAALTEIGKLLAARPDLRIYVVGHTDSIGALEANLTLSRARAEAVVTALEANYGVTPGRAVPAGVGPLAPIASNATDAGRALNRRLEIVAR
jgi:outer membrane protein OmpA-like peptidoglycan-associated protein